MKIGSFSIDAIHDGTGVEAAGEILSRPGVPDALICHRHHFGENGRWEFPVGGFLIRSEGKTILVDAGVGPQNDGAYTGGGLLAGLRNLGVEPGDVTDLVFTHLHFDHIGWASVNGSVPFANARYHLHQDDWKHFVEGPHRIDTAVEKFAPAHNRIEGFASDFSLMPGVEVQHVPGHTPGSSIISVTSNGQRALLIGDVAHSTIQFEERDWTVIWDADPVAASAVRNRIADAAANTDELIVAAHFPGMRFGHVVVQDGTRKFVAV